MRLAILACLLAAATPAVAAEAGPAAAPDPALAPAWPGLAAVRPGALSATTRFLSADVLEGRTTGSRGQEIAALHVATQMQALGLEPGAADGRFEQEVPLRAWSVDPGGSGLAIHGPGRPPVWLVRDEDFVALGNGENTEVEVDGGLAFAGFGVVAPEYGYDDVKGASLQGKIAVVLWGAPSSGRENFFPPGPRAVHADPASKMRLLASRGAAGVILVYTPEAEEALPWARFVQASRAEELSWLDGSRLGEGVQGLPARAVVSVRGLEKIAVAAGVPGGARGILEKAAAGRLTAQAWPLRARIQARSELREARSVNVLGLLRGSDPALSGEAVVVTARLDGRAVGEPARGDALRDGPGDGAAGVAVLLEVARAFASLPRRPARSVLFAAVTGGEEGSVGSSYLARHPAPAAPTVVAALEIDGAPTASPFEDVVAPGAEHSTLGLQVRSAAAALGVELSPVPASRAAAFVRSGAGAFARRGVPALSVSPGRGAPEGEPAARDALRRDRDPVRRVGWDAGWRWDDAARFARLPFLTAWLAADAAARPAWNPGDPFARLAPRR